jgi:hypothetical protein
MALLRRPLVPARRALSRCHPPTAPRACCGLRRRPRGRQRRPAAPATLADRLGIEAVIDELVSLGDRPGQHRPGRKVPTCATRWWLVATASTTPRWGAPGPPPRCSAPADAPCMLGTSRRAFAFGHIRQLDRVAEMVMAGRGRRARHQPMTLEWTPHLGGPRSPQGRRRLRLHPPARRPPWWPPGRQRCGAGCRSAHRAGGACGAGAEGFVNELAGRVRRASATGQVTLRADSGSCQPRCWPPAAATFGSRSPCPDKTWRPRPPPSPSRPGSTSTTPTAAKPKSPRPPSAATD